MTRADTTDADIELLADATFDIESLVLADTTRLLRRLDTVAPVLAGVLRTGRCSIPLLELDALNRELAHMLLTPSPPAVYRSGDTP